MVDRNRSVPRQTEISRRDMLRWLAISGGGAALAACGGKPASPAAENNQPVEKLSPPSAGPNGVYMSVAHGEDPAAITEAAIQALGGMELFVKPGYNVILKPNICTDYYPYEFGATTNPTVVATLVKLALGAGAKRVQVMDLPFGGTMESAYAKSGIADSVKAAGGEMVVMNNAKFKKTSIPNGKAIKSWPVYQDVLTCDLLIDIPVAKHHSLAGMTAGQKNLLGVVLDRNEIHADMGHRLPELVSIIRPKLTVLDAVRVLMRNGPTGGNLDDVKVNNTIVASQDIVAIDTYAAGLLNKKPEQVAYIKGAAEMGLGTMDLKSIKIEEVTV